MNRLYYINGETIAYDPGIEMIPFFCKLNPCFRVGSVQPTHGFIPKFQKLRRVQGVLEDVLLHLNIDEQSSSLFQDQKSTIQESGEICSGLDAVYRTALSTISKCCLCGWECKVNRYQKTGKCQLHNRYYNSAPFIHIAEEAVINPAIVAKFSGCSLSCCYCVDHDLLTPKSLPPTRPAPFWKQVNNHSKTNVPLNSLEFNNPTESLPGIFSLLKEAPQDFNLPVVMNCHMYGSKHFYKIADRITDTWLLDLRYGNDHCAERLSKVNKYMIFAKKGLDFLCSKGSRIIIRILVLPGHLECCHKPALKFLSDYKEKLWISLLDQYIPEHKAHLYHDLKRRPTQQEISQVREIACQYGLKDISEHNNHYWDD